MANVSKKNVFSAFLNKLECFPLWIKQIICLKLSEDIKAQVCEKFLQENSDNIFSLYQPILTYKGRQELEKRTCGFDLNIYNFLYYSENNANILEISLNTFLSMEEVAKYFIFCIYILFSSFSSFSSFSDRLSSFSSSLSSKK